MYYGCFLSILSVFIVLHKTVLKKVNFLQLKLLSYFLRYFPVFANISAKSWPNLLNFHFMRLKRGMFSHFPFLKAKVSTFQVAKRGKWIKICEHLCEIAAKAAKIPVTELGPTLSISTQKRWKYGIFLKIVLPTQMSNFGLKNISQTSTRSTKRYGQFLWMDDDFWLVNAVRFVI